LPTLSITRKAMLCAFDQFVRSIDRAVLLANHAVLLTDHPIVHQSVNRATIGRLRNVRPNYRISGSPQACI